MAFILFQHHGKNGNFCQIVKPEQVIEGYNLYGKVIEINQTSVVAKIYSEIYYFRLGEVTTGPNHEQLELLTLEEFVKRLDTFNAAYFVPKLLVDEFPGAFVYGEF